MTMRVPTSGRRAPVTILFLFVLLLAVAAPGCDGSDGAGGDGVGDGAIDDGGDGATEPADTPHTDASDTGAANTDATGGDTDEPAITHEWCDSSVHMVYAPHEADLLHAFPDDYFTTEEDGALRPDFSEARAPWLGDLPDAFRFVFEDTEMLDGFTNTAGVFLRFEAYLPGLPSGAGTAEEGPLALYELGSEGARRVPFEVEWLADETTVILRPMMPLAPATRHAAVLTSDYSLDGEGCVAPSATLRSLLEGDLPDPRYEATAAGLAEMLDATGLAAEQISAAVTFTTQSLYEPSRAAAALVPGLDLQWQSAPICIEETNYRRCEGTFLGYDFRVEGGTLSDAPDTLWSVPITIYLPKSGQGPWPTMVVGHGLGGDRTQAQFVSQLFGPLGVAVFAIDAPFHGQHPTMPASPTGTEPMTLLGIDFGSFTFDGPGLSNNFRQATLDKLQALELLWATPDVDGDGIEDLDLTRLAYFGVSLGGLMAPELLAMSDGFDAALLSVAGGRMASIIMEADQFALFKDFIALLADEPSDVDRLGLVVQGLIDVADPANFARRVMSDRFDAAPAPNVLFNIGIGDETIPNTTSLVLARALELATVQPFVLDPGLGPVVSAPLAGNLAEGQRTAGFFQIDRVTFETGGVPEAAAHNYTTFSFEGQVQAGRFVETWLGGGAPEIVDPFSILGTPALAQ